MDQPSTRNPSWTKEEILKLVTLFGEGKSMGEIGNAVGKSRNAVAGQIGKIRRKKLYDLPYRDAVISNINKRKRVLLEVKSVPKTVIIPTQHKPEKLRIRLQLIESKVAVTLLELEQSHCRWPMGDPKRPDFRFCGCQRVTGKPYCQEHVSLAGRLYSKVA